MKVYELKEERQNKLSALITYCGMFFAFSDKQFDENKTPLKEGEKYLRMFGGGFMPKGNLDKWEAGQKEIDTWFEEQLKTRNLRRDYIAYELHNHEATYTHDIEDTLSALGEGYTREEVTQVFHEELQNQD